MRFFVIFLITVLPATIYASEDIWKSAGVVRLKGEEAPGFTMEDLEGNNHSLKELRGKVVFLNFWATWCKPCTDEMPDMEKLYRRYENGGLAMVAVNYSESKDVVRDFIEMTGYTFLVLLDKDGSVRRKYRVRFIPTTFLIDKEGKMVGKVLGGREWDDEKIGELMEELLKR